MSIIAYKTNAIIITSIEGVKDLVKRATDPETNKSLIGKKIIVVEPTDFTEKKPKGYERTATLFCTLIAQAEHFKLDFVFILNYPEYLDPRIKVHIDEVKELK